MIKEIFIENYKSIQELKIELGRVTVFIGENGCGKTNILEAISLSSAAASDKLDNEFLASRGIRVTDSKFMRSAFDIDSLNKPIKISLDFEPEGKITYNLQHDGQPYSSWRASVDYGEKFESYLSNKVNRIANLFEKYPFEFSTQLIAILINKDIVPFYLNENKNSNELLNKLMNFLIFSPENSSLRIFNQEGQIQPLGIKGEGLFKLLTVLNLPDNQARLEEIKEKMQLIDWFENLEIPHNLYEGERVIKIKDRYLPSDLDYFNQNSSNEGFLFLLFYFSLLISDDTPKFFAVDNIDVSLNPRLGRRLIKELVELAKKYDKQVILTTHNPAILDGLNLEDDEQRLFVIYRNKLGHTKARRIFPPKPLEGQEPVRLSEAFLRGYIGGLPKNF
ncbi:AAA family ATPase [Kamptonema animale CS-326]|jgi:AAA15 family ATPase/GTPase|uniref:AAA family ATPase n=1 Tax=Kamptonema animale TaxID=92934 RepID=UPI00232E949F|nr:AAA family ATPase [Kamptonema animale]MDB9515152.1 AAA family ATPase [Kamptonema animale CS-326]